MSDIVHLQQNCVWKYIMTQHWNYQAIIFIYYFSGGDWFALLPFVGAVSFVIYATVKALLPQHLPPKIKVNPAIKKENPKVVDILEIEDLDKEKISYCRCWRSSKVSSQQRNNSICKCSYIIQFCNYHKYCLLLKKLC